MLPDNASNFFFKSDSRCQMALIALILLGYDTLKQVLQLTLIGVFEKAINQLFPE